MTEEQQRYRVIERLAAGGMAEVYKAESTSIEGFRKQVAIKRVLPHLSEKKRFIAMFLDEARLSANFSHSNVVQVFDIGVGDNTYFIVMEYVHGADLKGVMAHLRSNNRPFPIEAAILICSKICEGLAYAHEKTNADGEALNAVHRDISPPNVLLSEHGEVKIVDFGLAKASTQLEKSEAGIIKGKFHYLSPEAAHGQEVDQRADIFAVGIILWEMLAGKRLFTGKSDYEVVKAVQRCDVPAVSKINPQVRPEVDSILKRALARKASERYQSARALALDLTRFLFRFARPVDAFSLAELARGPMMSGARPREDGASIIDKLIQETLFEFTSLKADDEKGEPEDLSRPFQMGGFDFEDFGRLADAQDKGNQAAQLVRKTLASDIFEEGNLAALEGPEEPLPDLADRLTPEPMASVPPAVGSGSGAGLASDPTAASSPDVSQPASRASLVSVPRGEASSGGSALLKGLLLVLVAAGTAAALWFSGLL